MPGTAVQFAREAVAAAGYSFENKHCIATTPDALNRLERLLTAPILSVSSGDRVAISLIDLLAFFVYTVRPR